MERNEKYEKKERTRRKLYLKILNIRTSTRARANSKQVTKDDSLVRLSRPRVFRGRRSMDFSENSI